VVFLALTERSLLAYDAQPGLDVSQRVWVSGWPFLEDVVAAAQTLPEGRHVDGLRYLRGLVAAGSKRPVSRLEPQVRDGYNSGAHVIVCNLDKHDKHVKL
jgi:hypothetical protein